MLVPNKGSVLSLYQMPFPGVTQSGELHQCVFPAVECSTLLFITKGSSFGLSNRRGSGKRFLENTLGWVCCWATSSFSVIKTCSAKCWSILICIERSVEELTCCALSICVSCLRQLYFAFNIKNSIISSKLWHSTEDFLRKKQVYDRPCFWCCAVPDTLLYVLHGFW